MICPKCNRKYEDDMPKCLWCDAPNPNYGKDPTAIQEINQVDTPEDEEKSNSHKGTLLFWMGAILGGFGVHCFISGRTLRGILYAVFGGFTLNFLIGFLNPFGVSFPVGVYIFTNLASIVITILASIDLWKIARGKYTHQKKGFTYVGATWMIVIAILVYCVDGIVILAGTTKNIANGFFDINTYKSQLSSIQDCYETTAASIDDYIVRQEKFFAAEKHLGNFEDIAFIESVYKCNNSRHFQTQDLKIGISVSYRALKGCSRNSIWTYSASVQDDKLVWYATMPKDEKCKETFPKFYELKDKLEKQQTESSAQ